MHRHHFQPYRDGQLVSGGKGGCGQVKNGKAPRATIAHRHNWKGSPGNRHKLFCECGASKTL